MFADFFPEAFAGRPIVHTSPEALADLEYDDEIKLKNQVLKDFLQNAGMPPAEPVIPSPCFRQYRSTGKRRITCQGNQVCLHFGRIPKSVHEPVIHSALEPEEYTRIYQIIQQQLSRRIYRRIAETANYCIVRGTGKDHALILNVQYLSGEIVRALRSIADKVRQQVPSVQSAFIYVDETGSDYYLEAERPEEGIGWKKLFGPAQLSLQFTKPEVRKFLYPPAVFSQINESILPSFAENLTRLLDVQQGDHLLDLYCGYGLWSLLLAPRIHSVWGAELSRDAVQAARNNATYHYPDKVMHFETGSIDMNFLKKHLPAPAHDRELILLDPPRHGTAPGVLETLIARHPRKIAHVFCGVDEIPAAYRIYRANHCEVEAIYPFDFFPGTCNLEVLILIKPGD